MQTNTTQVTAKVPTNFCWHSFTFTSKRCSMDWTCGSQKKMLRRCCWRWSIGKWWKMSLPLKSIETWNGLGICLHKSKQKNRCFLLACANSSSLASRSFEISSCKRRLAAGQRVPRVYHHGWTPHPSMWRVALSHCKGWTPGNLHTAPRWVGDFWCIGRELQTLPFSY